MEKLTLVTIVGTRPEIIRLSRLIPRLDETFNQIIVHTGQNFDEKLNEIFFEELSLRQPDYFLGVDTSTLGAILGDTLKKIEEVFVTCKPDGVVILGDTNSSIAAVLAKRMQIPVYHLEAGNRSFDQNVPEETNRRMVDHVADFNLPYTELAYANLIREGLHPRRILKSGSPMFEILSHYGPLINASRILEKLNLSHGGYFLVSAHRQENVDDRSRLSALLETLEAIHEEWKIPVLVSTHPRTLSKLRDFPGFDETEGVIFHEPFGFLDYNKLQLSAFAVISDSGTISEESAILGFPSVTIRDSMERPEALESGHIVMSGLDKQNVIAGIYEATQNKFLEKRAIPDGYTVTNFSERVTRYILSTITRHHEWAGIRRL